MLYGLINYARESKLKENYSKIPPSLVLKLINFTYSISFIVAKW